VKIFFRTFPGGPPRISAWVLILGSVFIVALGLGAVFFVLRLVFGHSLFLGLLVLFIFFPLIGRFLFSLVLMALPALFLRFSSAGRASSKKTTDRDVIDVAYKVLD